VDTSLLSTHTAIAQLLLSEYCGRAAAVDELLLLLLLSHGCRHPAAAAAVARLCRGC
jgi:hypothetical protein